MRKDGIKYFGNIDCVCIPNKTPWSEADLKYSWFVLEPPFIIIPLEWDYNEEYKKFEVELKALVEKYFDKRLVKRFLNKEI